MIARVSDSHQVDMFALSSHRLVIEDVRDGFAPCGETRPFQVRDYMAAPFPISDSAEGLVRSGIFVVEDDFGRQGKDRRDS